MLLRQQLTGAAISWFPAGFWLLAMLLISPPAFAQPAPFSFQILRERARALAAKEYHPEVNPELPDFIKKLNYDEYRDIRFHQDLAPWQGEHLPFQFSFFHRGYLFPEPVPIHLIEEGQVHDFQYSPQQFDFGKNKFPKPPPPDLKFAGARVFYCPGTNRFEIAAFVGASYFRLIGLHQRYGASFRGLAVDTGEPTGEEFPRFTELWLEKPREQAAAFQIYALLDSPSCAGAFRFLITPGEITTCEVEASVFMRKDVAKIGFAPLTSMFLMAENRTRFIPDFRPEIHDSDGLLVHTGDNKWLWRPLVNPAKKHQVSRFPGDNVIGFGLLQRDTDFHHYEDLDSRYELRPSLWVEPKGNWGAGAVELVEIPSPTEGNDNIVAYWVPQEKAAAGREFSWTYQLSALAGNPPEPSLLRVEATRISPEHDKSPPHFVIDFAGAIPPEVPVNVPVEARLQTSRGEVHNLVAQKSEVTGGWRVFFDLVGAGSDPTDLRLTLHAGDWTLSETWIYVYQNEPPL